MTLAGLGLLVFVVAMLTLIGLGKDATGWTFAFLVGAAGVGAAVAMASSRDGGG